MSLQNITKIITEYLCSYRSLEAAACRIPGFGSRLLFVVSVFKSRSILYSRKSAMVYIKK